MTVQSTMHCNYDGCQRWTPYDPEMLDHLPDGWRELAATGDIQHFCSRVHVALAQFDGLGLNDVMIRENATDSDLVCLVPIAVALDGLTGKPLEYANVAYNRNTHQLVKARW